LSWSDRFEERAGKASKEECRKYHFEEKDLEE